MATKDNTAVPSEPKLVHDYISDMATQLAELAAVAGNQDLSQQLKQAAKFASQPQSDN
ncbi:hypothetical protein [Asticcacaulis tiandongensis]|uniref:hypothetical protein n=1 Tax=Asticcacaulis tiandongensis TaxID=2565365 RepID=UPI0015E86E55|nr:hypothetical protein [Asticcacaulis tiandongensis]